MYASGARVQHFACDVTRVPCDVRVCVLCLCDVLVCVVCVRCLLLSHRTNSLAAAR